MFNKKSIGLRKLLLISMIAFASIDLAANESTSNTIPAVDTDGDGHIDWFEIDVITNGQVHPDWDYGLTGFIGFVEHEDFDSAHEILQELRPSQNSRNQYLSRIRYCETNQSKKFSEFVTASRAAMQDENISAEEQDGNICQNQEIIIVDGDNNGHAEDNLDQSAESFLKASFRSLPADVRLYSENAFPRRDLSQFNRNTLNISRSAPLVLPDADEIYLEIEIRDSDSFGPVDFWVSLSNLGWKHQKPLDASPWGDMQCQINGEKIQGPFFPDLCDFNLYRIPLKSKSTEGIIHPANSHDFLDNVDTITLDFIRRFQYSCQWDYECFALKASHDIKNIKIVGGDRFPNDPDEYIDSDNDGIGGNSDNDNDNDGTLNELDAFPFNPIVKGDLDGDGVANLIDIDKDGDGVPVYTFRLGFTQPDYGYFDTLISEDDLYYRTAEEYGIELSNFQEIAKILGVNPENPLTITTTSGSEFVWPGGNEFMGDQDDDNDGYLYDYFYPGSENDAFPNDPTAWADIDLDCVPDNIDNDLNSIPDTDCDGLNNSIDTDDDNDSIPDSLIVPVIVEGALDTQWSAGSNIIDETGLNLCAIEDVESNPNGSCNQLAVSHQIDNGNTESGIFKLDFQKKSVINHPGTRRGIEFKTHDYLNIYSVSFGDRFYPVGYFEVDLKLDGATGGEDLGFNLISSNKKLSQTLPLDLKTYWPKVYSGDWTSLKIPLYDFFADMQHFEQIRQFLFTPDLAKISGLRVSSNLVESAYSVNIKNIQFVIEDKYPLEFAPCCFEDGFASNDFDNDGATGANDEHPFVVNIDTDNDGITDGVDDDIDGDNILNSHEIELGTDPYNSDTDGDGEDDGRDFSPLDPAIDGSLPLDISGTWRLARRPGAIGVGRSEGDIGDWYSTDFTLTERDCLFDDTYIFNAYIIDDQMRRSEGQFEQHMDGWTWLEPWQSPNGNWECGDTQEPFDGSTSDMRYEWNAAQGTLTLSGYGAHIGSPRVANYFENTGAIPVDLVTVYTIETATECFIALNIQSAGPSPWWHFELENIACIDDDPDNGDASEGDTGDTGGTVGDNANSSGGASAIIGTSYHETPFDMTIGFGQPIAPTVAGDGDIFSVPADAVDPSAPQANTGFAYNYGQIDINGQPDETAVNPLIDSPLTFGGGGAIVFSASVPSGGSADVYFKLERLAYDAEGNGVADTEPYYTTDTVTVSGSETGFYAFEIPSQYGSTFSNFILYLATPDIDVKINDIAVYVTPVVYTGDVRGPFDMTSPFGDAAIVDNGVGNDPYYVIDSSQGIGFAGFAYNYETAGYYANPLLDSPLTFGEGGTITFTASVPEGQSFNTADIRFRFEKEASESGDVNVTEPSCNSAAVTIQDSYSKEYEIALPIQADRTFSNIVMYIDTPDTNILISDIRVVTTPADASAEAVSCGLDTYGRQGPLDMTSPYGDGSIIDNGEDVDPYYRNDSSYGYGYAGYANSSIELYPFEFGEGGTLEFTAYVPEGQAETSVDIDFQLQKQGSDTGKFCDVAPIWEAPTQTVSGSVPETFTINIPAQGGNDFSNMIMEFSVDDIDVSITDVYVTTTEKTDDAPTVPEECSATPLPSIYPENGVNMAAMFNGTFGDEEGGLATIQNNDTYEFPTGSASYGGWANGNNSLHPIEYTGGGFFAQKKIYFCASTTEDATVYFRFENQPYPANTEIYSTNNVSLIADGVMHAYESDVPITYAVNSLLFLMLERDTPITMGKVMGNWNGQPLQDITTDSDNDGVVDYCEDFPISAPEDWVDTDNDGTSDAADAFLNDANFQLWNDYNGITQNIYSPSTNSDNSSNSESFSSEDNQSGNDLPANYLDYGQAKVLPNQSGEVQIPSGFEQIGYRAFNGLDIASVTIPDSVTVIESMAFRNNSQLTEVNFGQSITHIGTNAFANTAIQTVALPSTVTYLGSHAFANSEIEQVYLGDSVEYIGDNAFAGANISSLVIPSTLKYLGENAFDYLDGDVYVIAPADQYISIFDFPSTTSFYTCLGLDTEGNPAECTESYTAVANTVFDGPAALSHFDNGHISIPDTYRSIGDRAFEALKGQLTSVTIPEGITEIGSYAFKDLGLSSITLPNSIITIGDGAFAGNQLTNIILPNSLVYIGYAAFSGNSLGNVILPNSLTEIGAGAFIDSGINAVVLPESLLKIEQNAFANNAITNISFPGSLRFIGKKAFYENQINSIHYNAIGSVAEDAFNNNPIAQVTLNETAGNPNINPPHIHLLGEGEIAVIQTKDGNFVDIPTSEITVIKEDIIYYQTNDIDFSIEGEIVGIREDHRHGEIYNDPGATAFSIYFGNLPVTIFGTVNTELVGTHVLTYFVEDPLGNTATFKRFIDVVDRDAPEITLQGESLLIVDLGSPYIEYGATATDDVDGELDLVVTVFYRTEIDFNIVPTVDTSIAGEYRISYTSIDNAGNSDYVERVIIVAPSQNAVVNVLKDGSIDSTWNQGISAYDQDLNWGSCIAPNGCPNIGWAFVNDDALDEEGVPRGNVLEITHETAEKGTGLIIASSTPVDLRGAEDNGFITFDLKVTEGIKSISFNADCGYPCGGGQVTYTVSEYDVWETVAVPVASLIPNGPNGGSLDLEQVRSALVIQAFNNVFDDTKTVFSIDNVYYDCRAASCEGVFVPFIPVDWAATHEDPNDPVDNTPTSYPGYTQVWADEFNGNSVNPFNWNYDIGTGDNGWGNGELQYYRPENASVEDGLLIIEAKKHQPVLNLEPYNTEAKYTSSKLKTEGLFEFKYGRVDIRAVVAKGQGMWSAGWMLGANHSDIGWPYSGEIDIFDTIGGTRDGVPQEGMIVNNMYWNGTGSNPDTSAYAPVNIAANGAGEVRINDYNEGTTFSNTFHTFSLVWDEDKIEFQLDGETTKVVNLDDGSVLADTYRNPFYLILNVAVGGAWPGAPDETTEFPDGMLVDYVRVYQADSDGDGIADYELDGDTPLDQFPNDPTQQFYSENVTEYDSHPNGIRGTNYNISSASLDSDGDGVMDNEDAFVYDAQEWLDTDFDGIGNNADNDDDGDNHSDYIDDFPLDVTEWLDTDGDGIGNNSDADDDNDAVTDDQDAFPLIATEWLDTDGDGMGNNIDRDDDGDLTPDVDDLFPLSERDWQDIDNDGIGDNTDIDTDGDDVPNSLDAFPLNAYEWLDTDNAGVGDNADNDDDNDDVLDINDAFPLDASESMDADGDGIGNNADSDDDGDGVNDESDPAPLDPTITGLADKQIISVLGNPVGIVGKSTLVEVGYSTSNDDNTTTGIGFRIHYNSALMNIAKVIYLLEKDLVVEVTGPLPDSEDHDNDVNTDQYYSVGWASLYGNWPDEALPAKLLSLQVTIANDIDESGATSAPINFSSIALAAGYEFVAENYALDLITSTWDFDGSGHADALTDGLILLRYGFDLQGDNLVRGVMHPDSEMTAAEVEAKIESAANMIDIDMDGEYSALTDGLLLLRYLFDLTGQNLISDVLSPAATRTSAESITQHIERHMPADVFDNLQDDSVELITIALDQEGEISGTVDYDNSDFIKMNTVGAGMLAIEITPDNNDLDIDCGLTATTGPSDFFGQNFILDDYSAEIYNDLYDSGCKLTARFTDDREFYLFVDVADGQVTSGSYTVKYSFGVESGEYVVMLGDEGEILGEADYYNSDFIKMNTIGAGQLTIEITPDNNDVDIDCGLTSAIGPSNFGAVNFITDDNNIEILNDSDDSNCGFTATFVDDREFYLFVDFASEESGSYGISYAYNPLAQITD